MARHYAILAKKQLGTSYKTVFRGGSFNNTSNAGVFALNCNNPRTNSSNNIVFRSALLSCSDAELLR